MTVAYLMRVVGNWRRGARRLIGHPLACSLPPTLFILSSFYPVCLLTVLPPHLVVVASPVTPRRAHPETDDKVHSATPAYIARSFTYAHRYVHANTHRYTRRYTRERISRVGIDIRNSGKGRRVAPRNHKSCDALSRMLISNTSPPLLIGKDFWKALAY